MGHWNYRMIERALPAGRAGRAGGTQLAIHEVYYNDKDEPTSCTYEPVAAITFRELDTDPGDSEGTPEGLRWVLQKMLEAVDKPVLSYESFGVTESQQHGH